MYRRTWCEVNLDEIEENVRKIKGICGKKLIAVLKADAYGCGDIQTAQAVLDAGADMIAVSSLDEAMMLRNEGCDAEILILGATDPDDCATMIENNITAAAYSMDWIEKVSRNFCRGLKVHLKVDTGMNRIGFKDKDELKKALEALLNAECDVEGIFTHFCCTDTDPSMTDRQFARFKEAVEYLNYPFAWIHCDNSDATIMFKDDLSNACRLGVSMYGVSPYDKTLAHPLSLYTETAMVKHVPAGETIGYGATYTTKGDEIIATIPIGYADGFIRANQGRKVYVDGELCEVVGRVCMDQTMIRLDHEVPVGTKVEIFGQHISIESMAEELHTIPYEIMCLISGRVTRVYVRNGEQQSEMNERLQKSESE